MAAEKQKTESESEHLKRAATFTSAEHEVQKLEKRLQKFVGKTKLYFEQKENLVRGFIFKEIKILKTFPIAI